MHRLHGYRINRRRHDWSHTVIRLIIALLIASAITAQEIPAWVERGILFTESRSSFNADGTLNYVDKRTGKAGELGPYQMTIAAFNIVAKNGEKFTDLKRDRTLARECFQRYITWLYLNYSNESWIIAATRWNVGPHGNISQGAQYIKSVIEAGTK
jgi:hypothetical protein